MKSMKLVSSYGRKKKDGERKKERKIEPVAQRQDVVIGTLALLWQLLSKLFIDVSRAADPKGTKSCRTKGESVCMYVHLSVRLSVHLSVGVSMLVSEKPEPASMRS